LGYTCAEIDTSAAIMIEFLGKFHPLFVHLPIGFLLLLGLLEWLALRPSGKDLAVANRIILLLSVPASVASVVCGWLLAESGKYDASALFWHRWLGVGVAGAVVALWIIRQRGWMTAYRRGLFGTLVLLTIASHFGGTLTHGRDFLSWPKPRAAKPAPLAEAELLNQPAFATIIQSMFTEYCVECHGPDKSKGGLRMDTVEHLRAGGDSGSLFEPASPAPSLLAERLKLPLDDDDHMPPDGKPQLSPAQLAAVLWWLDSGAPTDNTPLNQLRPSPEILRTLQSALSSSAATTPETK
jgi:mono/diheme cytochrome c family protein